MSAGQTRRSERISALAARLDEEDQRTARAYWSNQDIEILVRSRSDFLDTLLRESWREHVGDAPDLALFALGGYGRREMFPHSDVDLLIVATNPEKQRAPIEGFLHDLYDLGLTVGHAVRRLKECRAQASADLTVATAMFERRPLAAPETTIAALDKILGGRRMWPPAKFFRAKRDEQVNRHKQFDNVDYGLEPNLKESPGGLRDLQTALWVMQRQFGTADPRALTERGVITELEHRWLDNGRRFLWWVRWGLHLLAGKKEDRLLFESQRALARRLGYVDTDARRGVERFMRDYYRHVLALTEVNDILLQYFDENVLRENKRAKVETIDERFEIRDNYIQIRSADVFRSEPSALLDLFVVMAYRRDIAGVRTDTIRAIRDHLHLIDDAFRVDPVNTANFLRLLKAPYTLVSQLTRLRRYGILSRYLPEFADVVGQMQHDLFHVYTVDAHTMQVIRNMRRFHFRASAETFPVAAHCVKSVPKIELLYIAGLYHDIGKGRGGDHSSIGADYARAFCERHGLNEADTDLVTWLVQRHLLMSSTAQRKDIYDPEVIQAFAAEVRSVMRLDYLYALTVADITATNPTLWNSWRATLLRQLYSETKRALRRGLEDPISRETAIAACREGVMEKAANEGFDAATLGRLIDELSDDFLLRHSPRQVLEIGKGVLAHDPTDDPLVVLRDFQGRWGDDVSTEFILHTVDQPNLFAASVVALDQLDLSVHAANIHTMPSGRSFNEYMILDSQGDPVSSDRDVRATLQRKLTAALRSPDTLHRVVERRLRRQLRQLQRPSRISITNDPSEPQTRLSLVASDRPGLLARIGLLFAELKISVHSARIATLGDRVEDVFLITDANGMRIDDAEVIYTLENTLRQRLDAGIEFAAISDMVDHA